MKKIWTKPKLIAEFKKIEAEIDKLYSKANGKLSKLVEKILKDGAQ